nr:fimbrillin family protein [uncultured Bacteroides sp.]
MKKSLFVLGVAVAALASCTQSEVLDIAESNVIKFDNAFVGNATKVTAPEVTTETIKEMYVYAQNNTGHTDPGETNYVFTNIKVYDDGTGTWVYDDLKEWETTGNTYYKFAAYAGTNLTDGTQVSFDWTNGLSFTGITIDGASQYDLVANGTPVVSSDPGNRGLVQFTFSHLLSMVKFTLKNGFDASTPIAISEFKFYGMKKTGDCSYNTSAWVWSNWADDVALGGTNFVGDGGDATTTAALENSWVVIPQTIADKTPVVQFKATVDGTEKTFTAKIPAITWQPGYRYNYIFTITAEDMELQNKYITFGAPTVDKWENYQDVTGGTIE